MTIVLLAPLADDADAWETETLVYLRSLYGDDSSIVKDFTENISVKKHYSDFKKNLYSDLNKNISLLKAQIKADSIKHRSRYQKFDFQSDKAPKVFISHKQEDKPYADALVNLINFIIGPSGDKVFCSSIPGYGIRQSKSIFEELKAQFDNHEIFMVIIHSPRYYESVVCLNEMGASWVLGTKFSSFMTKDCSFDLLRGVIGRESIFIDLNDKPGMLNAHLNDFKNDLLEFFGAGPVDENKWEHARERFVKEVSAINYDTTVRI